MEERATVQHWNRKVTSAMKEHATVEETFPVGSVDFDFDPFSRQRGRPTWKIKEIIVTQNKCNIWSPAPKGARHQAIVMRKMTRRLCKYWWSWSRDSNLALPEYEITVSAAATILPILYITRSSLQIPEISWRPLQTQAHPSVSCLMARSWISRTAWEWHTERSWLCCALADRVGILYEY
jgi:hypothetical protein